MDMVERVARAIHCAEDGKFDDCVANSPEYAAVLFKEARAAIEAMREPTEGMWWAGEDSICSSRGCECSPKQIYQTMIDAALKENDDG